MIPDTPASPRPGMPLHLKMLIGFVVGIGAGLLVHVLAPGAPWVSWLTTYVTQPVGQIFLNLLFMLVIPLLFSALVMGVAEMGDIRSLGRVGWRTLAYTVVVSSIAVIIGLVLVNLLRPGDGVDPALAQQLLTEGSARAQEIVSGSSTSGSGMAADRADRAEQRDRRRGRQRPAGGDVLRADVRHRPGADAAPPARRSSRARSRACSTSR